MSCGQLVDMLGAMQRHNPSKMHTPAEHAATKELPATFPNQNDENDNMSVDVKTYLAQLEKRKGKLGRWEAEIFQLFHARASYQEIVDFLRLNGVKAAKMEVYRFIHCKKRRHLMNADAAKDAPSENAKPHTGICKELEAAAAAGIDVNQSQKGSGMPKFNWTDSRKKDKPKW